MYRFEIPEEEILELEQQKWREMSVEHLSDEVPALRRNEFRNHRLELAKPIRTAHTYEETFEEYSDSGLPESLGFIYVFAVLCLYYFLWLFAYQIVTEEIGWEEKIAGSHLTVGALFVVACVYFWFQIFLHKLSTMYRTGVLISKVLLTVITQLVLAVLERFQK